MTIAPQPRPAAHVSVIVPVHNVAPYVRRCIESVVAQTYESWELILVDDGSSDGSGTICDEYASLDHRIRVIHQAHGGPSRARNVGLDAATCTNLTFLDSDDWWHRQFLEHLLTVLETAGADVAVCQFSRVSQFVADQPLDAGIVVWDRDTALAELISGRRTVLVTAWGKVYRAQILDGVRFPDGRLHEDEFTAPRIFVCADRVVVSSAVAYYYMQRPDSIVGSGHSLQRGRELVDAARAQLGGVSQLQDQQLTAAAAAFLLRRLIHHHRWATTHAEHDEAAAVRGEIRTLLGRAGELQVGKLARSLGAAYVHVPRTTHLVHSGYLCAGNAGRAARRWSARFLR